MNWVDIIILIVLAIGLFKGFGNGFVRGLFGLAAVVLGIMFAAGNYEQVAEVLLSRLAISEQWQSILAFLIIFVVTLILVNVVGKIISKALKLSALGWLDRLVGGVLGLIMSCLFIGMILMLLVMAGLHTNPGVARSTVAPTVIAVMDMVVRYAPETAREKIESQYVKLRLEWEKARQEPPEKEGDKTEEGETVSALEAVVSPPVALSEGRGVVIRGA
jgi:membrane protein required for colicin V production